MPQISDEYLTTVKSLSPEKRSEQMSKIQKMFNRAKEYSDDKVQLAIQTYELVDKHIRRLDSDLAKFEAEIKEKALNNNKKEEETNSKKSKFIIFLIGVTVQLQEPMLFEVQYERGG
ncbi:Inhibitor of growth protein 5 [Portunus trituberculatus]|uniref:Inhibitor of growth protein 5 n=1 Tax=Portunus trituberculatus TaxID=210409 RepID=A0A5B7DWI3_PORTR|nr:Inhibitor of growth protein 5 [Portunus trituberculatus]